jgi:hypothetical protein
MTGAPVDPLEADVLSGAIRALRNRAAAIRKRAAPGVTRLDRPPGVIVTSESATALRIAKDFDAIAAELEAEAAQ